MISYWPCQIRCGSSYLFYLLKYQPLLPVLLNYDLLYSAFLLTFMIDYFLHSPTNIQGYIWERKQRVFFDLKCPTVSWSILFSYEFFNRLFCPLARKYPGIYPGEKTKSPLILKCPTVPRIRLP